MTLFTLIFEIFLLFIIYKALILVWALISPSQKTEPKAEEDPFFKIDKTKAEDIDFEEIEEK